jgi:hypothetical protein
MVSLLCLCAIVDFALINRESVEKLLLEEQLSSLTKMFDDLSVRVTEAETARDEALVHIQLFNCCCCCCVIALLFLLLGNCQK